MHASAAPICQLFPEYRHTHWNQALARRVVYLTLFLSFFLLSRSPILLLSFLGAHPQILLSCCHYQGLAHPPATSTHSAKQDPCLPSTSTISVSHLHLHPTPFSLTGSHASQYSSSSFRFFSSSVVDSRKGDRAICRAGAFAGQC